MRFLGNLLKYANCFIKKKDIVFPEWDLDKVLGMLFNPPIRNKKDLLFNFKKTLFLTALADPKRI